METQSHNKQNQPSKKRKARKVVGIVGAWLTVPILGLVLLWLTTILSVSMFLGESEIVYTTPGMLMLNGFFGLLTLTVLILAVWRLRRKSYFSQLMIGLWIGVGLYALLLGAGIIAYYTVTNNTAEVSAARCTNPTEKYRQFGAAVVPIATDLGNGTGFSIDAEGRVLTAYHVIEGAQHIVANYATGEVALSVVDSAPEYDLALLKLERFEATHFPLSSSYVTGDEVLAYGYPDNAYSAGAPSLSKGIISRVMDVADLRMTVQNTPSGLELIQTDAAINPGNSGGALIGRCGVVGIIVSVSDSAGLSEYIGSVSEQGIGYAVSASTAAARFKLPLSSPE